MPNDVITLQPIVTELNLALANGKIDKISMPENDEIVLSIRASATNHSLAISVNPSAPRIHLTSIKKNNQLTAPAFCMLLRKYLIGGQINNVSLFNNDRIINIEITSRNDLQDICQYILTIELMGRYSNIILLSQDYVIIDAIRRIPFDSTTTRYIIPNMQYKLQPNRKLTLNQKDEIKNAILNSQDIAMTVINDISGLSKESAKEVCLSGNPTKIAQDIDELSNIINLPSYNPCLLLDSNNNPKDYFVRNYQSIKGNYCSYPSLNSALDAFYAVHDTESRKKSHTSHLTVLLKRLVTKNNKKFDDVKKITQQSEEGQKFQHIGELITNYIYLIKKGDSLLKCFDYKNDVEISLDLDTTLTPQQNAQFYFKKYNKIKRSQEFVDSQVPLLNAQKDYLDSIAAALQTCTNDKEYQEIELELNTLGALKKAPTKIKQKIKPSAPLKFNIDNFDILIGKNNIQNNNITFEIAESNDLWLHCKAHHGSHGIIKAKNEIVPDETIAKVASIVAYYSDAKNSPKVEIDYTLKRLVKKHPNGLPGMVIYSSYRSILVEPKKPQ